MQKSRKGPAFRIIACNQNGLSGHKASSSPRPSHFAMKGRTANSKPARSLGHLPAIMRHGETDGIALDILEGASRCHVGQSAAPNAAPISGVSVPVVVSGSGQETANAGDGSIAG